MMKYLRITLAIIFALAFKPSVHAQGWPENYEGVMLQGFYWDSFDATNWNVLKSQAEELGQYFSLVWLPQSANCGGTSMGYDDLYWFPGHYNSSFGNEAELRSLIQTFKSKGIGTIADVVINHRKNVSNWVDFPKETNVEMMLGDMRIILFPRDAFEKMVSRKFQYPEGFNGTVELAFDVPTFADVDKEYQNALNNGAKPVLVPTTEPWGQRTCYIADPDGNLIEIGSFVEG